LNLYSSEGGVLSYSKGAGHSRTGAGSLVCTAATNIMFLASVRADLMQPQVTIKEFSPGLSQKIYG
jgi:hypothetical protein